MNESTLIENGKWIMARIHKHNTDAGGVFTETTGAQGSGKTSILFSFMKNILLNNPGEKIFFSECYRSPLQVFKLGYKYVNFLVKEDIDFSFRDRNNNLVPIDFPITRFSDYMDCYHKAKADKVNVVFFGNRLFWMNFIDSLRDVGEWNHVFIDEMSEVCPAYQSGSLWRIIGDFAQYVLKDVRKDMINLHYNTQKKDAIDDRVRKQIMIKIYLPGAIRDKHSRVWQKTIDALQIDNEHGNQAIVEYSGKFGRTTFDEIFKPNSKFHVDAVVNTNGGSSVLFPSFRTAQLRMKYDNNINQ